MSPFLLGVSLSSRDRVLGRTLVYSHGEASFFSDTVNFDLVLQKNGLLMVRVRRQPRTREQNNAPFSLTNHNQEIFMKTAVSVLAVCSLAICFACSCAKKPDAGAGQPDVRLSQPDVRPVQQTEYDYDKVISEIKNNFSEPQRNVLEATHYCLEIYSLIDGEIYPGRKLDKFELERQFRKIAAEEYNFSNFEDETFNLLMGVIEKIKNLRISEGERELLNEMYVREKRIAWIHALPEYIPINVDWKQFVASSVQTLI